MKNLAENVSEKTSLRRRVLHRSMRMLKWASRLKGWGGEEGSPGKGEVCWGLVAGLSTGGAGAFQAATICERSVLLRGESQTVLFQSG